MYCGWNLWVIIIREISSIVLNNINDKDTTNIVGLQMNAGFNT
jgi:hypothetical protein